MATQLGDLQIDSIEGTTVRGWFRSIYNKNVHTANPGWGAELLYDAFSSLSGLHRVESELRPHIRSVVFDTPNTTSTKFTVEVDDPGVLAGLGLVLHRLTPAAARSTISPARRARVR